MTETKFRTEHLPLAAYIVAARKLPFTGAELNENGGNGGNDRVVTFVFDDPKDEGERINIQFEAGAEVAAVTYYDSMRRLRRVVAATLAREGNLEGQFEGRGRDRRDGRGLDDGRKFGRKFQPEKEQSHESHRYTSR